MSKENEISRYALASDDYLMALRRRIAAGEYAVNAPNVAGSIVSNLNQINRARRAMDARAAEVSEAMLQEDLGAGDRTPREPESTRRAREPRRPDQEPSSR
jgi:hypothetical protein